MNCKFCGGQLNGTEAVCPICGNAVIPNNQPGVVSNPMNQPVPGVNTIPAPTGIPEMNLNPAVPGVSPQAFAQPMPQTGPAPQTQIPTPQPVPEMGITEPMANPMAPPTPAVNGMTPPLAQPQPVPEPNQAVETPSMPTPIDPAVVAATSQTAMPIGPQTIPQPEPPAQPQPTPIDPATVAGVNGIAMPQQPNPNGLPPTPTMNNQNQTADKPPKQPKNKKTIFLFILLGILAAGLASYYIFIYPEPDSGDNTGSKASDKNKKADDTEEDDSETVKNTTKYAGYIFTVPSGYLSEVTTNGLQLTSYDTAYIIALDYTNNYEGYTSYFTTLYPDQTQTLATKVLNREYLMAHYQGADSTFGTRFVTKTEDNHLFVGTILKVGGVASVANDYSDLTTVLDNAVVDTENPLTTGGDLDAGRSGAYEAMPLASTITFNTN